MPAGRAGSVGSDVGSTAVRVNDVSRLNKSVPSLQINTKLFKLAVKLERRMKQVWYCDSNEKPAPELPARTRNVASSLYKGPFSNGWSLNCEASWRKYQPGYPIDSNEIVIMPGIVIKPATIFQVESSVSNALPEFNVLIRA